MHAERVRVVIRRSRARKPYSCVRCSKAISIGETYYRYEPHPLARYHRGAPVRHFCERCATELEIAAVNVPITYVSRPLARQIETLTSVGVDHTIPPDIQHEFPFEGESTHLADAYVDLPEASESQELAICETEVSVVEFSRELLAQLQQDPTELLKLTPEQLELLLCDRLDAMGWEPRRVGSIYVPDGGIDIVTFPREPAAFPFLVGVQCKHHKSWTEKVGVGEVREFDAVIRNRPLQAGLFVTNTSFTPNATWEIENHKHIIRLRDFEDLRRWIADNFVDEAEWREVPERIEYTPGKFLDLRRGLRA